jgi:hypothetical protein
MEAVPCIEDDCIVYAKAEDKEEEMSFDEKRMFG